MLNYPTLQTHLVAFLLGIATYFAILEFLHRYFPQRATHCNQPHHPLPSEEGDLTPNPSEDLTTAIFQMEASAAYIANHTTGSPLTHHALLISHGIHALSQRIETNLSTAYMQGYTQGIQDKPIAPTQS